MRTFEQVVDVILNRALPLLIGSGVGVVAILAGYDSLRRLFGGTMTTGTVVGYELVEDCYCPIIEFTARDGSQHHFTSGSGRGTKQYREGARVRIVYDPAREDRATIRSFSSLWLLPIMLAVFAALFVCAGLGVFGHAK
jgi:hypothetical protein